jgi:hypothetical protein
MQRAHRHLNNGTCRCVTTAAGCQGCGQGLDSTMKDMRVVELAWEWST